MCWIILCCRGMTCECRVFSIVPDLYPPDASSKTPLLPTPVITIQKCLRTLPNVPWGSGAKSMPLENHSFTLILWNEKLANSHILNAHTHTGNYEREVLPSLPRRAAVTSSRREGDNGVGGVIRSSKCIIYIIILNHSQNVGTPGMGKRGNLGQNGRKDTFDEKQTQVLTQNEPIRRGHTVTFNASV